MGFEEKYEVDTAVKDPKKIQISADAYAVVEILSEILKQLGRPNG